jgi:hypothetical protein
MLRSSLLSTVSTVRWSESGLADPDAVSAISGLTSIAASNYTRAYQDSLWQTIVAVSLRLQRAIERHR